MSKIVWTGIESQGKSLMLSRTAEDVLARNIKWLSITGIPRTMMFNSPMSREFVERVKEAGIKYLEYKRLDEILYSEETDIFMDEVIKFFPANGSNGLSNEQIHFITQGAKSGICLYAASQDFSQVHKQFRLLVNQVFIVKKLIGSERPMKTAPPVKRIWGICIQTEVEPKSFKGDSVTMETIGMPKPFLIRKKDCKRFDTSFKIPMTTLPIKKLRKQIAICDEDGYKKITYV